MLKLAKILDALPYGIMVTDANLRLESINAWWWENLLEAFFTLPPQAVPSPQALAGTALLDIFCITQRDKWQAIARQLLSGASALYSENIAFLHQGAERWVNLVIAPLMVGQPGVVDGLLFNARDITQALQAENQLRAANVRLETLVSTINLMSELQQDMPLLVESIVYLIADVYEAGCVQYFFSDDESGQVEKYIVEDRSSNGLGQTRIELAGLQNLVDEQGTTGWIELSGGILNSLAAALPGAAPARPTLYSLVSTRSRVIGGILVYDPGTTSFSAADQMAILGAITQQLGLYLDNAALYAEQQQLAVTDGLTGLNNRRHLDEELIKEVKRSDRFQRPVSVLMMDIDNFKRFNDTFGHPAGDRLLKHLATIFLHQLRTTDIVARYGGEEFMIILPETDENNARIIAERLRKRVMNEGAQVIAHMDPAYTVTISIGIAAVPTHAITPEGLMQVADEALYRAKHGGKNQVVVGDDPEQPQEPSPDRDSPTP